MSGKIISERWLIERLAGIEYEGKPIKLHRHPAPNTATYPHISIAIVSAVDLYQIGNTSAYERLQYMIRVWDKGSAAMRVNAIAKDIHKRIHQVEPEMYPDGQMVSCFRVGALATGPYEEQNGEIFVADGGLYQFHVVTYDE